MLFLLLLLRPEIPILVDLAKLEAAKLLLQRPRIFRQTSGSMVLMKLIVFSRSSFEPQNFSASGHPCSWEQCIVRATRSMRQNCKAYSERGQELCESRGGRPGLPAPNSPYGLCGRKATLKDPALELWSHMGRRLCVTDTCETLLVL